MTDKEYDKHKKRIQKLTKKLTGPLGFNWFSIDIVYDRHYDSEEPRTIARCYANADYMMASITFYMPEVADQPDDRLEHVYIHELCHILLAPLAINPSDSTCEQSTELVARTIGYAMNNFGGKNESN